MLGAICRTGLAIALTTTLVVGQGTTPQLPDGPESPISTPSLDASQDPDPAVPDRSDPSAPGARPQDPQPQDPQPKDPAPQDPAPQDPQPQSADPRTVERLPAIQALLENIQTKKREIQSATADPAVDAKRVTNLRQELDSLETDFESLVTGIDREQLEGGGGTKSIQQDLEELLRPIIEELKSATEEPRQLERLRTQVLDQEQRAKTADTAIRNIRELQQKAQTPGVIAALEDVYEEWQQEKASAINGKTIAKAQLEQRERDRKSLVEAASGLVGGFFRSKGFNLLLAIAAFAAVFLGMRFAANRFLDRGVSKKKRRENPFYFRLIHVLYFTAVIVLSVVAALLVLYAAGDWVLLGVALLLLFGVVWTAKESLPRFLEQIRLLLNLGAVREGERIIFEGIPWLVESLSLYTQIVNPALSGGRMRLPLRTLIGLHSRPVHDKEAWFPSGEGDWVLLSDDTRGRVIKQTPELVQLVKLGGSRVTYQTPDYLSQNPENLSANFRLKVTFGVDYMHQAICTTEIPQRMKERLKEAVVTSVGEDKLINLAVEFKTAGSSSLDYEVLADFHGDVAARYDALQRLIQRVLVDACNENGWVIPFTQVTIHQAGA